MDDMTRRKMLATGIGAVAGLTVGGGAAMNPVRAQRIQPPPIFFKLAVFTNTEELIQWTFPFDTWEFGNRQAYDTAWWYFLDNGSEVYSGTRAIRLLLQQYGAIYIKINDRNGIQNETSGRLAPLEYVHPYPDLSVEVASPITFVKRDPANPKIPMVIGEFNPKADDLGDSDVHWYYQGAGILVALYGTDVILRLAIQSARDDVSWLSPLG